MATIKEQVQQLYIAYFNRPGDAAGVEYYVDLLEDGVSIDVLRADFVGSKEYTDTYAGKSTEAVVNQIYTNLFGHSADIPGLKYYAGLIDAKTVGYDILPWLIANGAQTTDITAFANKATAAAAFTDAIAADANLRVAYANGGEAAINTARGYLSSVNDTAGSLASALAGVATTVQGVVPVTTTTLTAGLDNFVGGTGNDVINAFASNPTTGADATTLTSVDSVDGGAGTDTLNIEVKENAAGTGLLNGALVGTIKNIEIVNINQEGIGTQTAIDVDASKLGTSLQQVWQSGNAGDVTNLSNTATAGFRNIATDVNVAIAAAATNGAVALDSYAEGKTISISGGKLANVVVTGSVVDTDEDGEVGQTTLDITAAKDVQTVTVNTAIGTKLEVSNAGGKAVTTVDASASTGDIEFDADDTVTSIKGGSGADKLTLNTITAAATTTTAAVNASIAGGAGDDEITVKTSGDGTTTVDAGEGDDTVNIASRGDGILTVNLGAGNDVFTSDVEIGAKDKIDAGAGTDTLLLKLVGAANIGAFSNFDVFDAAGLNRTLDVDILAAKNNVTEFVATADVGAATLTNVGANVGFRATGDLGASTLTLTQKTGGALTVTVDADETGTADDTVDTITASVNATNATSVKAVFGTSYLASTAAEPTTGDNITTLNLTSATATAVTVESGGALSNNDLNVTGAKLATITVTGDRVLDLSIGGTSAVTSVDSSASTGGLVFSLAGLKDGGSVTLGSGVDLITVDNSSFVTGFESIKGFEKAAAAAVGTNASAAATAIADADQLVLTGATAVAADSEAAAGNVENGVLTFNGAGPATLAAAATTAAGIAAEGQALVFEYLGNSYVFVNVAGTTTDTVVQIAGVTGVNNFALEDGSTNHFFLV